MLNTVALVCSGVAVGVTVLAGALSGSPLVDKLVSGSVMQPCVTGGVTVDYVTEFADGEYVIHAVGITSIPADCAGDTLTVSLNGASNLPLATTTVLADRSGNSVVPVPDVAMGAVTHADVTVIG